MRGVKMTNCYCCQGRIKALTGPRPIPNSSGGYILLLRHKAAQKHTKHTLYKKKIDTNKNYKKYPQ